MNHPLLKTLVILSFALVALQLLTCMSPNWLATFPISDEPYIVKVKCAKVSVIIPITPDRLHHTPTLLNSIANGTRMPCEIIFSLSSFNNKTEQSFDPILPAQLKEGSTKSMVLPTELNLNAAENRNRATAASTMPIVASLDLEDLATPILIETIETVYEAD
jgi:hypothetical protein